MEAGFDRFHGAEVARCPQHFIVLLADCCTHAEAHKHHLRRFVSRLVPNGIGRNNDAERFGAVDVVGGALRYVDSVQTYLLLFECEVESIDFSCLKLIVGNQPGVEPQLVGEIVGVYGELQRNIVEV